MTEDRMIEEIHNLANEVDVLKNKLMLREDLIESLKHRTVMLLDRAEILDQHLELSRKTQERLRVNGSNLQVEVNLLKEERWATRKLEEHKLKSKTDATNIAEGNFMEGAIADMDCGEPEWVNDPYGL